MGTNEEDRNAKNIEKQLGDGKANWTKEQKAAREKFDAAKARSKGKPDEGNVTLVV